MVIAVMKDGGLSPIVLSAYRSYFEQAYTYNIWQVEDPAYGSQVRAPPGRSEHQLGTVVDLGSPELPRLTGDSLM